MAEESNARCEKVGKPAKILIPALTVVIGAFALGKLECKDRTKEKKGGIVHFFFPDGSMGRLQDLNGDGTADAIVRVIPGQRPVTEFAAPEYMGKTPGHYHGTRVMGERLRNSASLTYQRNRGFLHQLSEALKKKQKR